MSKKTDWPRGSDRGALMPMSAERFTHSRVVDRQLYDLRHLAIYDRLPPKPPRAPERMICAVCESVPMSKQAKTNFRVRPDGSAWLCAKHARAEGLR